MEHLLEKIKFLKEPKFDIDLNDAKSLIAAIPDNKKAIVEYEIIVQSSKYF